MNISQPFIHHSIATSLQFHHAANDQIIDAEPFSDAINAYRAPWRKQRLTPPRHPSRP
jgi:hypothetical protein